MKLTKASRNFLILLAVFSLAAVFSLRHISFDYDFERFFPVDDPELEYYLDFREKFGTDNDLTLIAFENEAGVFEEEFLLKVEALCKDLDSVPYVTGVMSPTRLNYFVNGPLGPIQAKYIHLDRPDLYPTDSARIYSSELALNSFISETKPAISVLIQAEEMLSKVKSDTQALAITQVLENYEFDKVVTSGRILGQKHFVERIQSELVLFTLIGAIMLILFLAFTFRTLWGVWVPLMVVGLSAVWLLAFMVFVGKALDPLGTLLPIILFVVGVSDIVHILSKYLEELRWKQPKIKAIRKSFREVGLATFLTSATTAIGFLSLNTTTVIPLREFGSYMALGVMIAYVLAFTVLPAVLILRPKPKIASKSFHTVRSFVALHRSFLWLVKRPKSVLLIWAGIILLSVWGILQLEVNGFILQDLSKNDPFRKDLEYLEKNFSGIRPLEIALISEGNVLDYQSLREQERLEAFVKREYKAGFVSSPLTIVKMANMANHGGDHAYFRMPDTEQEFKRMKPILRRISKSKVARNLISEDGTLGHFSAKAPDLGSGYMTTKREELHALNEAFRSEALQVKLTGTANLLDINNEKVTASLLQGLLLAFGLVSVIVGLIYRSLIMMVVSLIPNVIPLMVVAAGMAAMNIPLNISTAIVFTIAFGIAVDDTIHFLSKFKIELRNGKSFLYSLKRTYLSTGKAILMTSLILCSGFISLTFSSFASTFNIGLFVCLTLVFAVLADLTLLPILLIVLKKRLDRS
jgi:predicted RND superfamily exporter protein